MKKMSEKNDVSHLSYGESFLTGFTVTSLSLFCQWLNWFIYEKLDYTWWYTLITPLILCGMYHFVQTDAGRNGNFSRHFFFMFSVLIPFLAGILVTVIMILANPQISVFNPQEEYRGTVQEVIAVYSGRIVITSLYLLVFSAVDVFLLRVHGSGKD